MEPYHYQGISDNVNDAARSAIITLLELAYLRNKQRPLELL